jgi:hypothetical protein
VLCGDQRRVSRQRTCGVFCVSARVYTRKFVSSRRATGTPRLRPNDSAATHRMSESSDAARAVLGDGAAMPADVNRADAC